MGTQRSSAICPPFVEGYFNFPQTYSRKYLMTAIGISRPNNNDPVRAVLELAMLVCPGETFLSRLDRIQ